MTVGTVKPIVKTAERGKPGKTVAYGRCGSCDRLISCFTSSWARNGLQCACGVKTYYHARDWVEIPVEDESTFDITKYVKPAKPQRAATRERLNRPKPEKRPVGRPLKIKGATGSITADKLAPQRPAIRFDAQPLFARLDRIADGLERVASVLECVYNISK